ncbi:MAG: class I SAM-dependent methyltransferase [Acidobacteriota bacterium]
MTPPSLDLDHVEHLSSVEPQPFSEKLTEISVDDHFWFEWRWRVVDRLLRDHALPVDRPLRALEIGSGSGVLRRQLEARTAWTVDATDLNLEALARNRSRRGGRTFFYDAQDRNPELVGAYEVVLLFEVLEHIEHTRPFLEAVFAHLAPGGWFVLDVPALQFFFSVYDRAAGHFRRYDKPMLGAELEPFPALDLLELRYWGFLQLPLLAARNAVSRTTRDPEKVIARGFEAPPEPLHAMLRGLMHVDLRLPRRPPVGTSLLMVARKREAASIDDAHRAVA